jgi:hypothetical protein
MKLEHATACLLTGWFLITPPMHADGRYDTSAPISKWKVEGGAASLQECKDTQALLSSRATKEGRASDVEAVKDARCVSQEDPRLEAK